jgi:holo-[acyl-carrier protein] synthase
MIVGIGIDLVEIPRVDRLLAAKGERVLRRLFTEAEAAYAMRGAHPAQHLAVRLAAKEAAFKALAGTEMARGIGWKEIEVVRGVDGRPNLTLHGRAWERATELGVTTIHLSLTHARTTAGAVVVLESREP